MSLPVLVHGKSLHPEDFKILHHRKVVFRGLHRIVVIAKCGASLRELVVRHGSKYRVP
jgi:hypothetical protein